MGDGEAVATSGSGTASKLIQTNTLNGKYAKVSLDVSNYGGSGVILVDFGSTNSPYILSNGTHILYGTYDQNDFQIYKTDSFSGSIDNISVIEITDDTDLPRINYTNFDYENGEVVPYSGTGSLLLEPQSTNLITYSEDFSEWSLGQGGAGSAVVISNNAISPDGNNTADKVVLDMNGGTTSSDFSFITISYTSSVTTFTLSCYLKGVNGGEEIFFDLDNGNNNLITLTNEWVRYDFTKTVSTTGTRAIRIGLRGGSTTDDTASFYIYGAQLEEQSYATSYIPNLNGEVNGVTRLADVCNNAGSSDLINSTEGVLYAEIKTLTELSTFRQINLNDGTTVNRIYISKRADNSNLEFRMDNPLGSLNFSIPKNTTNNYLKLAFRYGLNNFAVFVDGVSQNVSSTGNTFSANTLNNLELTSPINQNFEGNVKCVAVFKEALDNDQLERLTGEGYESFNLLAQANNYTII
jgi:hypothetical protein